MAKHSQADERQPAASPASRFAKTDRYGDFLSHLQASLKANDRRTILGLVGFPLRVKFDGGTRTYRSLPEVERDFERIFTLQLTSAILNLRSEGLTSREGGRLIGKGRIWFGCGTTSCSSSAPIRIRELQS